MSEGDIQTDNQPENLKRLFTIFDSDGDGKISSTEVALALQKYHEKYSAEEIGYMMRFFDLDKNALVDFSEFVKMAELFKTNPGLTAEFQIRQLFRAADKNKDGVLCSEELKKLWSLAPSDKTSKKLTENEMDDMIRAIDTNGDGKVDYEEFFNLLSSS